MSEAQAYDFAPNRKAASSGSPPVRRGVMPRVSCARIKKDGYAVLGDRRKYHDFSF
jgi:hypothetical protein